MKTPLTWSISHNLKPLSGARSSTQRLVLLVLLMVLGVRCGIPLAPASETGRVVDVVDGDTIWVEMNGEEFKVRYIGINAPELARDGQAEQPFASLAEDANRRLVLGQVVRLEKDISDTDQFGRLLRYVYLGDTFVNAELVRLGMARARAYPPDTTLQQELYAAQDQARSRGVGIWSAE